MYAEYTVTHHNPLTISHKGRLIECAGYNLVEAPDLVFLSYGNEHVAIFTPQTTGERIFQAVVDHSVDGQMSEARI